MRSSRRPAPSAPRAPSGARISGSASTRRSRTGWRSWPTASWRPASPTRRSAPWPSTPGGGGRGRRCVFVVGAHSADFVWRAGGAVAVATRNGGTAQVIALSYGERGESGELWKQPGQTIEHVKEVRHAEAAKAAAALGAEFKALDFGDYPLEVGPERFIEVVDAIREFAPDVLITHTDTDPFNPDHPVAFEVVQRAPSPPAGAGLASAFESIAPPALFLFEPHQPELCNFMPTTFVDITPVIEAKREAMKAMEAQKYLRTYYDQRAEQRAHHARRASGNQAVRYAEAFQRVLPQVVTEL